MKRLYLLVSILLFLAVPVFAQVHFTPVDPTGISYAIVIQDASYNDETLVAGDEIAVFDGELCVGADVVGEAWPLSISAWQGDAGQGLEGYTIGHQIRFKIYINDSELELDGDPTYVVGDGTFGSGFGSNISSLDVLTANEPDVAVSPESYDFGQVLVDDSAEADFTISNDGTALLTLTEVSCNVPEFVVSEPSDYTLDPGQSITVTVTFTPAAVQTYEGIVTVYSDDPDEGMKNATFAGTGYETAGGHFTPVDATGISYAIVIQEALIDESLLVSDDEIGIFDGDLCVGAQVLDGDWPVSITAWQGDAGQGLEGFTIGHTISYKVFSAEGSVELDAEATYITGDGTFGSGFGSNISLLQATTGGGGTPDISVSPESHDFGPVLVGGSASTIFTITNTGDALLTLTGAISSNDAFTFTEPSDLTLEPDQQVEAQVDFTPFLTQAYEATITIYSDDPDEPTFTVSVTGSGEEISETHFIPVEPTGISYAIVIQNAFLDEEQLVAGDEIAVFDGELCVGSEVITGTWPVSITAWQGDAGQGLEGFTIGHTILYKVYSLADEVEEDAEPTYLVGDGTFGSGFGSNVGVLNAFSGGGAPDIEFSTTAVDFGSVNVGDQGVFEVTITNNGDAVLNLMDAISDEDAFMTGEPEDLSLDPGQQIVVELYFHPTLAEDYSGTLNVYSDDPDESPTAISLSGTGTGTPVAYFVPVDATALAYPITVTAASIDEAPFAVGDEIAVFDGTICVGAKVVDGTWPMLITAWEAYPDHEMPGFTNGHEINFRVYDTSAELAAVGDATYSTGDGNFGFGEGSTVSQLTATTAGDDPDIAFFEDSHDFGEVNVNYTESWSLYIENLGSSDLVITNIVSSDPAFYHELTFPQTISPSGTMLPSIYFQPTDYSTEYEATLTVYSNDPDEGEAVVTLYGQTPPPGPHFTSVEPTGIGYAVVVQLATVDEEELVEGDEIGLFDGELCVGSFIFENEWPASITAWQGDAAQELDGFTVGHPIIFKIWASGLLQELDGTPTYAVGDGTYGSGFGTNVTLLTAVSQELYPDIYMEEDEHDFGEVILGQEENWVASIQNLGDADLTISMISSSSDAYNTDDPGVIPPGESRNINIRFFPAVVGEQDATITLTTNDPDESEYVISVTGTGVPVPVPDIHIEETAHDFGNVLVDESGEWSLQIFNLGNADLTISSMSIADTDSFAVEFTENIVVEPEGFVNVPVTFNPTLIGFVDDVLHVVSDDPDEEDLTVDLSGTGVSLPTEFSLIAPVADSVLAELPATFNWHRAFDADPGDEVSYQVEFSEEPEFAEPAVHDAGTDTFLVVDDLNDDMTYYWRVRAVDTNSDSSRLSTEEWVFSTAIPDAPTWFDLETPEDSTWIAYEPPLAVDFTWTQSVDPDPEGEVTYIFLAHVTYSDLVDTTVALEGLTDTTYTVNIPDSLLFTAWTDTLKVLWWVDAVSQDDTTHSDSQNNLFFAPSLSVPDYTGMPMSYGIKALYPNPFNPTATVVVGLPVASQLRVEVFNLLGQRVALLSDGFQQAGHHRFVVNGHHMASGVYFVRATSPGQAVEMRKMVLMR